MSSNSTVREEVSRKTILEIMDADIKSTRERNTGSSQVMHTDSGSFEIDDIHEIEPENWGHVSVGFNGKLRYNPPPPY